MKSIGVVLTILAGFLSAASSTETDERAMSAGDLQQACVAQDATSKTACRVYILGVTQGITVGMGMADGKVSGGRPCIPDNVSGGALELAVKMKLGADLTVYPADRELDAAGFIGAVMVKTFACSKPRH